MKKIYQTTYIFSLCLMLLFSGFSRASDNFGNTIPSDKDVILKFGSPSQDAFTKRFNILVWNLHKGADLNFASDYLSLAYQKDLIMAQEMYLDSLMLMVFGTFPHYFNASASSFFSGRDQVRTGLISNSKVAPSSISYLRTLIREPVANSPKISLITQYPIRNSTKQLTVVNIHGINFVDSISYASEIKRISESLKDVKGPMIVAGDFNSWNNERFESLRIMRKNLKLSEAKFEPDFRITFNKHVLDHFFHTSDIKIISAKVEDFYKGSDHNPLELVVELIN